MLKTKATGGQEIESAYLNINSVKVASKYYLHSCMRKIAVYCRAYVFSNHPHLTNRLNTSGRSIYVHILNI